MKGKYLASISVLHSQLSLSYLFGSPRGNRLFARPDPPFFAVGCFIQQQRLSIQLKMPEKQLLHGI